MARRLSTQTSTKPSAVPPQDNAASNTRTRKRTPWDERAYLLSQLEKSRWRVAGSDLSDAFDDDSGQSIQKLRILRKAALETSVSWVDFRNAVWTYTNKRREERQSEIARRKAACFGQARLGCSDSKQTILDDFRSALQDARLATVVENADQAGDDDARSQGAPNALSNVEVEHEHERCNEGERDEGGLNHGHEDAEAEQQGREEGGREHVEEAHGDKELGEAAHGRGEHAESQDDEEEHDEHRGRDDHPDQDSASDGMNNGDHQSLNGRLDQPPRNDALNNLSKSPADGSSAEVPASAPRQGFRPKRHRRVRSPESPNWRRPNSPAYRGKKRRLFEPITTTHGDRRQVPNGCHITESEIRTPINRAHQLHSKQPSATSDSIERGRNIRVNGQAARESTLTPLSIYISEPYSPTQASRESPFSTPDNPTSTAMLQRLLSPSPHSPRSPLIVPLKLGKPQMAPDRSKMASNRNDPTPAIDQLETRVTELNQRIVEVEKENRELKSKIEQLEQAHAPTASVLTSQLRTICQSLQERSQQFNTKLNQHLAEPWPDALASMEDPSGYAFENLDADLMEAITTYRERLNSTEVARTEIAHDLGALKRDLENELTALNANRQQLDQIHGALRSMAPQEPAEPSLQQAAALPTIGALAYYLANTACEGKELATARAQMTSIHEEITGSYAKLQECQGQLRSRRHRFEKVIDRLRQSQQEEAERGARLVRHAEMIGCRLALMPVEDQALSERLP